MPQSFQVDLRGVVDLLSRHLYSSPSVYLRELLQNAVDALHARELREPGFRGSVRIAAGTDAGGTPTLVVRDDGIGLTEDEVHAFLATIGRSSKRDELDFPRGDFLGQFGIGLLSCFMVSDEITVVTRSATGAPAIRWQGRSDGSYTLEPLATTSSRAPRSTCGPGPTGPSCWTRPPSAPWRRSSAGCCPGR